jgi:uncharacterized repeat protein (TIGR01451 family)
MERNMTMHSKMRALLACGVAMVAVGVLAPASLASGPAFKLYVPAPDSVLAGERIPLKISIRNVGDANATGAITFTDTVSPGLEPPSGEEASWGSSAGERVPLEGSPECATSGRTMTCTVPGPLPPGAQLWVRFNIKVEEGASGLLKNEASVSGGETAGTVSGDAPMDVGPPQPFAFTQAAAALLDANGGEALRAASDPAEFTTSLGFRSFSSHFLGAFGMTVSVEHFKDVTVHLPPGLIGNPSIVPALCTAQRLSEFATANTANCPLDSQVGIAHVYLTGFAGVESYLTGLFDMVPPPGIATELGFQIDGSAIVLQAHVRPSDHGIDIVSQNTTTTLPVTGVEIETWGVPADSSHDPMRGACLNTVYEGSNGERCPTTVPRRAFLRLPTSCSGEPLSLSAVANSYEHPDHFIERSFSSPAQTGCEVVPFAPRISVSPTGTAADSPTGLSVKVSLPQNTNPDGLAEADLKKAVVRLPEGMAINPSAADGLQACTDAQLGLGASGPSECPDGSKIGTVLLHTPLLGEPIEGLVYVRTQNSSDPESGEMFRIAMELRNDQRGIDIKVPGQISVNRATGQLTTTFDDNPQLPFSDVTLSFKSGARAPLATPASCEPQTTESDMYSWAQPDATVHRATTFTLTSGPEGTPCVSTQPFNPGFDAGVQSVQAGGFTPFLATFTRKDADQPMQRVSVKMPEGLLGSLVGLPLCPEGQANAGTCSPASEIGTVTAGAGAGPTPFYVTGGKVFMTGPYEGAPFGLSVVVPAKAGPFDLGVVVVRAKVEVDIHTAQLTVTTDPLPQIVDGVPVNLRLVNVTVNRPNFTYNPTDCEPTTVTGSMTGGQGATAVRSDHFQVTNCGALKFQPRFTVRVSGKPSRKDGESLDAKLTYPRTPQGTEANIAKVKVSLPKQLPSRLTTLQKACAAETFDANPAACPSASRVGSATAVTPVLPVPLSGPVYFVSHGGQAFPDLVVVLQGYGVTVDLVGTTFISKAGITSTTFKQVPDVPVGSFELKLPQGPYSALAANGNLCKGKLNMPTAFVAQDGATIHRSTPIGVAGCARHRSRHHKGSPAHGMGGGK